MTNTILKGSFLKHFFILFLISFFCLLTPGCKKGTTLSNEKKEENISLSEIKEWFSWYKKNMPDAPVPAFEKAQKTFFNNQFIVRVPLNGSTGHIYFTKTNSLQVEFIRIIPKGPTIEYPFTGWYEFIDMNSFAYKRISFENGKQDKVLVNSARQNNGQNNKYTTNASWLSMFFYCLSHYLFAVPARDASGNWTGCNVLGSSASEANEKVAEPEFEASGSYFDWSSFFVSTVPPTTGSGNIWNPFIGTTGATNSYSLATQTLLMILPLNQGQINWLDNNVTYANELIEVLSEESVITTETVKATLLVIDLYRCSNNPEASLIPQPDPNASPADIRIPEGATSEEIFFSLVNNRLPGINANPILPPKYIVALSIEAAYIKLEHPEWTNLQVIWAATKEVLHLGLDVIGLVPVVGSLADLTNGMLYSFDGEGTMAALSYLSAIPGAGYYAKGIKLAKETVFLNNGRRIFLRWMVRTDDLINFSYRGQLRKVLGLAAGDARQAHHLIPWEFWDNAIVQAAAKAETPFHMNRALNGIALDKAVHVEGMVHDTYNTSVRTALRAIESRLGSNITPALAKQELEILIGKIRTWITQNPGVNLNNIIL